MEDLEIISVTAEANRIDVKTAMSTFGIGKSLFYGRYLKDCQITPVKATGRSYITWEEFELLRGYHLARNSSNEDLERFLTQINGQVAINAEQKTLMGLFKNFVPATIYQKLIFRLQLLEQYASVSHARLSTNELSQILEISNRTLWSKKEYQKLGFLFRRDRQGWQVLVNSDLERK
ncbi:hypothetical protein VF14_03365 [Nostoc linckia z18]|uniref:Uncharacterized protein n=2 Tax=Nostoc linckia TaxID=92942 RepID=A0A9Q5ZGM4_NOSLI|nr:hypothetical protein [Nostoc linckia]PHK42414.1 hypothetical protein VF12_03380 [Nostoc linckia z15]PHK46922.1 hypothetical protein VF13_08005 [Nostoc linckia z16]PHJ69184.1 hypothetical protein VF02_00835 [Nostoc linckia z1]PHJ73335.1 hypothetical protein VF05_01850 [Nostoc linckia z3]PHJ78682.1 hypothetical protein VF03_00835 [Nostoc linckia z2]